MMDATHKRIKKTFFHFLLLSGLLTITGCGNPIGFGTNPIQIPVDEALAQQASYEETKVFLKRVPINTLPPDPTDPYDSPLPECLFNWQADTVILRDDFGKQGQTYHMKDVSLHIRRLPLGRDNIWLYLTPRGSSAKGRPFCNFVFHSKQAEVVWPTSQNKKRLVLGANIFHALGVEIQSQYRRPKTEEEDYIPVYAWYQAKLNAKQQAVVDKNAARKDQAQQDYEARMTKVMTRDAKLPLTVRKDKYLLPLTDHLKNEEFAQALFYFDILERLNIELDSEFTYFWGEALLRTDQTNPALDKLYQYAQQVGPSGQYYSQALTLINEAEEQG